MRHSPDSHHRRSIRLSRWDYGEAGAYFVTLCTYGREPLFGSLAGGVITLNHLGTIVHACWHDLVNHYGFVGLDEFVTMPNHVHGLIFLRHAATVGAGLRPAPTAPTTTPAAPTPARRFGGFTNGLPEVVRAFKSFSGRRINEVRGTPGTPVWQRNYYERVVRNERELDAIREYIHTNPRRWAEDPDNPINLAAALPPQPPQPPQPP